MTPCGSGWAGVAPSAPVDVVGVLVAGAEAVGAWACVLAGAVTVFVTVTVLVWVEPPHAARAQKKGTRRRRGIPGRRMAPDRFPSRADRKPDSVPAEGASVAAVARWGV